MIRQILERTRKIAQLRGIQHLLSWDQETHMPEAASTSRQEHIALVAGLIHSMQVDQELYEQITSTTAQGEDERLILEKLHRDYTRKRCLPRDLVENIAKKTSEAMQVWQRAKKENSWSLFLPHLEEVFQLSQKRADCLIRAGLASSPYEALMDEFEPSPDIASIDSFFSEVKKGVVPLLEARVRKNGPKPQSVQLQAPYDVQKMACHELITRIGYDWSKSRLDGSSHPFSTAIHPHDSRITIRSDTSEGAINQTISQLMSALHEAGHSLYEMGLPIEHYGTPLCEPVSLSIHESQSRLWETVIGRSKPFIPILQDVLRTTYMRRNITILDEELEQLYDVLTWVQPSYIRCEADEVSYPLHILLRYEMETELFSGQLLIRDIPQRWNDGMKELFGIVPPTDREGCLQDIHWSMGMFGYFPTYAIGSWYATLLMKGMEKDIPNISEKMAQGNFWPIHDWLQKNIWSHGRRYNSFDLIARSLGSSNGSSKPSPSDYIAYLRGKYA